MNDLDDDLAVDLTPLIDVTFMLVIFFLMTMSFCHKRKQHRSSLSALP